MRAVLQRVQQASVVVDGDVVGAIDAGLLILLGVAPDDTKAQAQWLANKVAGLRIFADDQGRMNRSVLDIDGGCLAISQFTLFGDTRKGRRPSFVGAAPPDIASPLYDHFCGLLLETGVQKVERGIFGADMKVSLINDGPVTLIVDTPTR